MGSLNGDWLAQMAPAHAPPPPGWWPPAPGWWGLALLLALLAAVWIYRLRRPAGRLRRAALREFERLDSESNDDVRLAAELEHLMRRYAVAAYGREAVAPLSGSAWLDFVVAHGGGDLAGEAGQALLRAAYGSPVAADRARWLKGARGFVGARR
ncbi:MAG: DUF4381 domain-containing protein [Betaproteobacteria bacterium]|nr:DUF4381 domain-containing protein [Betaproteobacteria bacterium]